MAAAISIYLLLLSLIINLSFNLEPRAAFPTSQRYALMLNSD